MELIVKIGADQVGLQKQIANMKSQFANANMSMPAGWTPRPPSSPMRLSAGQQEFLDAQDAASGGGFLQKKVGKMYLKKSMSFLKGIIVGEVIGLAAEGLKILGDKYWESVYGVSEAANAKIQASHEKITKAVAGRLGAKSEFGEKLAASTYEHADLDTKITMNQQGKAAADAQVKEKQKAFDEARQRVEDDKSGATTIGIGEDQRAMTAQERQADVIAMARAEEELYKARIKQLEITDKLQGTLEDRVKRDRALKEEVANKKNAESLEQETITQIKPFAADSMAQAGLFTGGSLLMNPTLTVQQDQLKVLREIAVNTGTNPFTP